MAASRVTRYLGTLVATTLLVVVASLACAESLSPITIRLSKRVLRLSEPAIRAVDEVYAPLSLLDALGVKYRVTAHEESVVLKTPEGAEREIGLARPGKQAMVPVSSVAATIGYAMRLTDRGCELSKPGGAEADTHQAPTLRSVPPAERSPGLSAPPKSVVQQPGAVDGGDPQAGTLAAARARQAAEHVPAREVEQPKNRVPGPNKPDPSPRDPDRKAAGDIQRSDALDGAADAASGGAGAPGAGLPVTVAPRSPLPGVDRDLLCPTVDAPHLQLVDFVAPDLAHAQLRLYFSRPVNPEVVFLANPSRIAIDIANAAVDDLPECRIDHPFARGATVSPGPTRGSVRITLLLGRLVTYGLAETAPGVFALNLRLPKGAGIRPEDAVVVIDPGHGGKQTGCQLKAGDGCIEEKALTLAIAKRVQAELRALGIAHTYLTRTDDCIVELYDRPKIAAAHNADLFVSVHVDEWAKSTAACGPTAYYHHADESSRALAQSLIGHVARASVSPSRGALSDGVLYASGLAVLRTATMPASLVECGFLTNPNDRKALVTDEYQVKIAKAIASGIRGYLSASLPDQPVAELTTE